MINRIVKIISRTSSNRYIKYLRKKGIQIGKGTEFFYPMTGFIDDTRPWLIKIGKNVQITKNVTIITHGYDWSVLKNKYGEILGSAGKVEIGDNVFIGFNATILKGVTIGNNVIIGANSLVNKSFPSGVVIAGNPAKIIMTIDEYYKKRKERQAEEAKELVKEYIKSYNQFPNEKILREFYFLFKEREEKSFLDSDFESIMNITNNYEMSKETFLKTKPLYNGYEEFKRSFHFMNK